MKKKPMDKAAIEQFIHDSVRAAAQGAAADCIRRLNEDGHAFSEGPEDSTWVDEKAGQLLEVMCSVGVGITPLSEAMAAADPVTEAFYALVDSGTDPVATTLSQFEGDVSNGGFTQLFDNKGVEFVREAITHLQAIGAKAAAKIATQALELHEERQGVVKAYDQLQADFDKLDSRYWNLSLDIPALYARRKGA